MTTKQTIEVEGLPEGWKPIRYGWPKKNIDYIFDGLGVKLFLGKEDHAMLIVEKIQTRRIVLEVTTDVRKVKSNEYYLDRRGNLAFWSSNGESIEKYRIAREVKATDIPLTNEVKMGVSQGDGEPKLELSVKEARNVRSLIKDFENLGWSINPERSLLLQKITEFTKDK